MGRRGWREAEKKRKDRKGEKSGRQAERRAEKTRDRPERAREGWGSFIR